MKYKSICSPLFLLHALFTLLLGFLLKNRHWVSMVINACCFCLILCMSSLFYGGHYISLLKTHGTESFCLSGNVLVRKNNRTEQLILLRSSSRSIQKRSIQKWNKLSRDVRTIRSKSKFKRMLKQHLLQQFKLVPLESNVGGFKSYFYL